MCHRQQRQSPMKNALVNTCSQFMQTVDYRCLMAMTMKHCALPGLVSKIKTIIWYRKSTLLITVIRSNIYKG